ncbi:MAG TPA: DUF3095 domain-containing protein [Herpetosiphonaceae bacterium]
MADDFYARLGILDDFRDLAAPEHFAPLPADWSLILTDIRDSTGAIRDGRYRSITLIGASSIAAALNAAGDCEIPFAFGGDGATIAAPPRLAGPIAAALQGLRALAAREFGLELRIGVVPVADILAAGWPVTVAKHRVSEQYAQALFGGGGLAHAERLLKDPVAGGLYNLPAAEGPEPDLRGLECRWQDIRSRHGETLSLLVRATAREPRRNDQTYRELLAEIERIYGGEPDHHPVALPALRPSFAPAGLFGETRLRGGMGWLRRQRYLWKIWLQNHLLKLFVWREIQTGDTEWRRYPPLLVATTDYKKYDDVLRMVIAGTTAQRYELEAYLQERYGDGLLAYGLHVSDRALLTCLVFERMGRQVHFVDAADGGYALAAQALKSRLAELPPVEPPLLERVA